jgi:hypothetical protein
MFFDKSFFLNKKKLDTSFDSRPFPAGDIALTTGLTSDTEEQGLFKIFIVYT